jgi:hypothetical protein|tara:strand:+ start:255 stop:467 length:213 start_codon:yes stop_codon:yes gene_type:complete
MSTPLTKPTCKVFNKASCIDDLKELVEYLVDRDELIKDNLSNIKSILNDKTIKTDLLKIRKIKQILKNGK